MRVSRGCWRRKIEREGVLYINQLCFIMLLFSLNKELNLEMKLDESIELENSLRERMRERETLVGEVV